MKKNRIKSDICPNCQSRLEVSDNFCPNCGQENDNKRQSIGKVLSDLITGFLSVDSRFANSIPALLFRPGYLTTQYIAGKRNRYLNPVRMFISIVVVYFLFATTGDSIKLNNDQQNAANTIDSVLTAEGGKPVVIADSVAGADKEPDLEIGVEDYPKIRELVKAGITETDAVLDTLGKEKTFWKRFWYSEMIKFAATDFEEFKKYLLSKLPWIVFMLMPVFALLLKLFYIRKRILYVDHLIFAFHLHSFVFLAGWIYLLIEKYTNADPALLFSWLTVFYTVAALRNVYGQSWFKSVFKLFLLSILYMISGLISLLISLLIIFLIW